MNREYIISSPFITTNSITHCGVEVVLFDFAGLLPSKVTSSIFVKAIVHVSRFKKIKLGLLV